VTLSAATWRKRSRLGYAFCAGLVALSIAAASSFAQEAPPQAGQGAVPAAAAAPAVKPQASDSVGARLTRIEEKLGDLQVLVGALESFIRSKPGAMLPQETPGGAAGSQAQSGDLSPRVDALETQIGALTSQLEQMNQQLSALKAEPGAQAPVALPPSNPPPDRQGQADPSSPSALADMAGTAGDASDTSKPRWYGPKPGEDQVSALPGGEAHPLLPPAQEGGAPGGWPESAALPDSNVHSLYERGYGALSQRDYAGAEAAFRQLIESYPKDPLAGNAQYWIGESFYRRGQYKNAADAFLKGYKKYKSGDKAPETLLKLGMSLAALGQKDAACSTFGELKSKYPAAPEPVRDEAKAEQKKARC
jgi:tol-pal system protein YbgF